jgi:putative transcriptional regulator
MQNKFRSDAIAAIHGIMEALHEVGAIDKQTMRRLDNACLTQARLSSKQIKALRKPRPPDRVREPSKGNPELR